MRTKKLKCSPNGVGYWTVTYRKQNVGLCKTLNEVRYWFPIKNGWEIVVLES